MENIESVIDKCFKCSNKNISKCFDCQSYKVRVKIWEIQSKLTELKDKDKINNYCLFINEKYYDTISNIIKFPLGLDVYKRDLDYLLSDENIIAIWYKKTYNTLL